MALCGILAALKPTAGSLIRLKSKYRMAVEASDGSKLSLVPLVGGDATVTLLAFYALAIEVGLTIFRTRDKSYAAT